MTTLALGRGSMIGLAICLFLIIALSFILGMVSVASRVHENTARTETAAARECVPAAGGAEAKGEGAEGKAAEGGGEGEGEGEDTIAGRARRQAQQTAKDQAQRATEGPLEEFSEMLREHLDEFRELFPQDPRLNPAIFLDKEIDEAKEDQDKQMQEMLFSDKPGGAEGGVPVEGQAAPAAEPAPAEKPKPVAAAPKPAPEPKLPTVQLPPMAPAGAQSSYTIDLGSFRSEANAESFAQEIHKRGYPVEIDAQRDAFGQGWYYVRLGHYPDSIEAAQQLEAFESREGINGVLVMQPPGQAPAAPAAAAK